jgi:redox-sensitive bicupin YhaK (pirin superfamily)
MPRTLSQAALRLTQKITCLLPWLNWLLNPIPLSRRTSQVVTMDSFMFREGQVLWLERGTVDEQTEVKIHVEEKPHIMLYAGQPAEEKVVARGPFVMNSEEIVQVYKDYKAGRFE